MNILITGAFGFVGTNLSLAIKKAFNCSLIALDIIEPDIHVYDVFYAWNELDKIDWSKTDIIIHLAGKAHDTKNAIEEKAYFDINVGLTQTIFEYFLKSGAEKFIFFSSVKAVADNVSEEFLTEEALPNPQTAYGKSKLEAEKYILNKSHTSDFRLPTSGSGLPTSNKKVYTLRPCMIHGPGNKGNLNLLYKLVQKGIPWPLGAFDNRRSFCSVGNVAYVVAQLLEQAIAPGTYHLADDEALSTNELIGLMGESLGRKVRIWQLPCPLMHRLARLGGTLHLPLNPERLHKLTENYVVSNSKIKQALGISQLPVNTRQGLKETVRGFG